VAITAVGSGCGRNVISNLACGIHPIMAGFAREGVSCQYVVIKYTGHIVTGRVVALVACNRNIARGGMRMRRRILSGNRYAICHCTHAVVAAGLAASARNDDCWIRMVRKGRSKCRRVVAVVTFYGNTRMAGRAGIGASTNGDSAVVTRRTR